MVGCPGGRGGERYRFSGCVRGLGRGGLSGRIWLDRLLTEPLIEQLEVVVTQAHHGPLGVDGMDTAQRELPEPPPTCRPRDRRSARIPQRELRSPTSDGLGSLPQPSSFPPPGRRHPVTHSFHPDSRSPARSLLLPRFIRGKVLPATERHRDFPTGKYEADDPVRNLPGRP